MAEEENIKDSINEIKNDIAAIKTALQGSPLDGRNGLADRVVKLENKMTDIERFKWKIIGFWTAAIFIITYVINKI